MKFSHLKTAGLLAAAALALGAGAAAQAEAPRLPGTKRTDLQQHDLAAPGFEALQARIDIAPGVLAPRHTHPGEEVIYVLEGVLEYQVGDGPWTRYKAGDVLFVPDGVPHAARNTGTVNGAELATYVVRKGEPLLKLAK